MAFVIDHRSDTVAENWNVFIQGLQDNHCLPTAFRRPTFDEFKIWREAVLLYYQENSQLEEEDFDALLDALLLAQGIDPFDNHDPEEYKSEIRGIIQVKIALNNLTQGQ
jgi:hypothetical protein